MFGHTQAGAGRNALKAQKINMQRKAQEEKASMDLEAKHHEGEAGTIGAPFSTHMIGAMPDPTSGHDSYKDAENPSAAQTMLPQASHSFLPRRAEAPCRINIQRNHWVPPVPGYSGFVPARYSENICGGGLSHTAKMCARAIQERRPPETESMKLTVQDNAPRDRMVKHFHENNKNDPAENRRLAENYKKHCSTKIPGYTGHIPRKDGDSVFGATACRAHQVCMDIAVDKLENPYDHITATVAPQFPAPRQCYP